MKAVKAFVAVVFKQSRSGFPPARQLAERFVIETKKQFCLNQDRGFPHELACAGASCELG